MRTHYLLFHRRDKHENGGGVLDDGERFSLPDRTAQNSEGLQVVGRTCHLILSGDLEAVLKKMIISVTRTFAVLPRTILCIDLPQ